MFCIISATRATTSSLRTKYSFQVKREDADLNKIAKEDHKLAYTTFYDILNDLMVKPSLDIYVIGSNSRMLSKDIAANCQ